ncbi:MAG TPA: OmpA family protein [Paludibacteraceae bacterium]|nr:OmpA family protein [Paludibacteraceae bacterium]HOU68669.1 OmpA family protein [Paludibacteraceae bacterium]HPH63319.1 OmpA family protein [Paludibacteraceae bacterium]HQF50475.1 OmpA family protein [Paludibacteraceae bacterium]
MKRVLLTVSMLVAWVNTFAGVHEEFSDGYEFVPSVASTKVQELPMSFYKDGKVVFFRGDSAYIAKIGDSFELVNVEVCLELCGLGIEGTFAYDQKRRTIYFAKTDELGNSDLYEAQYLEGGYSIPKKMSIEGLNKVRKPIRGSSTVSAGWTYRYNRISGFFNPSIAKNGDRVYFSADFPKDSYGGRDIWYVDRNKGEKSAKWAMPVNASDSVVKLNSNAREDFAYVFGDSIMYLASNRPGGMGGLDLYISRLQQDTTTVEDTVKKTSKTEVREIWGVPTLMDSVFNTSANDYNLIGSDKIVLLMSNRQGGVGSDDIYRPAPFVAEREKELLPDETIDEPKGFHWVLFFFDFNQATMKPEYEAQLDELVGAMKEFPGAVFEVSGHTDSRGPDDYNMKLSQRRADYIRNMLIQRGLTPDKLVSVGKGETEPVIPNATEEAEHEQNRRADIKIINE